MAQEPFLSRWAKRKSQARSGAAPEAPEPVPKPAAAAAEAAASEAQSAPPQALPPVESLTPQSDFTGFMQPKVDEALRRRALKTLFQDPHFNLMDGLDVYIGDYSIPDPLPPEWLGQLRQMTRLGSFEEKPPEEAADPSAEPSGDGVQEPEKPSLEQGLATPASSDTSDTLDAGSAPPQVRE